jgi:tyrosine-protein kinase Etk/Wzc
MTTEQLAEPLDVLLLLLRRWRTVAVFTLLGLACGAVYAYLATPWYAATITVIPSQHAPQGGGPGGVAPNGLDALALDVQRIKSVLVSSAVIDAVADRFALDAHDRTMDRQRMRELLGQRCYAYVDKDPGLVALACEDTSPAFAARMAELFGEEGNRVFGNIFVSSAREERKFLEAQVEKTRRDLAEASRKLREFQRTYKIIDLPEQSKAVISAMATIEGEIVSKQLELSYLAGFSADTESNVVQLKHQLAALAAQLKQLETAGTTRTSDFFPAAMSVPELRFQLDELVREQKLQETLFFVMNQRYETAKVDEARDTSTFQILEHATVPSQPFKPKRRQLVELGCLMGAALSSAWILVPVWWRRRTRRLT